MEMFCIGGLYGVSCQYTALWDVMVISVIVSPEEINRS
jgi:hypothetical protein